MLDVLQHLERDEVGAVLDERFGELAVRGFFGRGVRIRAHVEVRRQARDRARDRDVRAARVARLARRFDGARD